MGIPNLLDPRMLSQVGETPPLQQNPAPVNLQLPPPPPTSAPPPLVPPPDMSGMGLDALPGVPQRETPQPTFAQILVKSIPMLLAGIAARKAGPSATSGMLAGYADAMEKRRLLEEKQHEFDVQTAATEEDRQMRRQEYQATRQARIGTWMTSVVNSLQGIDDPGAFAAAVKLYDDTGVKALGLPPGFITTQFGGRFDNTKAMTKAQKDAQERLALVKTQLGENFDDAVANNATLTDPKTGKRQSIRDLMALAGLDVTGAQGEPIATTPKVKSEFEQLEADVKAEVQRQQKDRGGPLTPSEVTAIRNKIRGEAAAAVRAEPNVQETTLAGPGGLPVKGTFNPKTKRYEFARDEKTGQLIPAPPSAALINMQKEDQPPKPIDPGTPEYQVAQDMALGRLTFSQFRTLAGYWRNAQEKFNIYYTATQINPNFNAADFERGFTFIKNPQTGRQLSSLDNALSGVPDLLAASEAANRSGVTYLNKVTTPFKIGMGKKSFSNLNTARLAWADEVSGALGFGTASDMKLQLGLDLTDPNLSVDNFRSAIQDVVVPFLERKRAAILKQASVYGGPDNNTSVDQPPADTGGTGRQTGAGPAGGPPPPPPPKRQEPTINGLTVTGPTGVPHTYPTLAQAQSAYNAFKAMK